MYKHRRTVLLDSRQIRTLTPSSCLLSRRLTTTRGAMSAAGNPEGFMPYRKPRDGTELPPWKQDFNAGRRKVR